MATSRQKLCRQLGCPSARDVEQTVQREVNEASSDLQRSWENGLPPELSTSASAAEGALASPPPDYKHPKKNWRLKRGAMPAWYKQRQGIRTKALSGAARVARFRPRPLGK